MTLTLENLLILHSHIAVIKSQFYEQVTFLVIDKEGDTYYKLKGVKVVASMVVAKELIEEIAGMQSLCHIVKYITNE